MFWKTLWIVSLVVFLGCGKGDSSSTSEQQNGEYGPGRLYRWSGQTGDFSKVLIFIHGRYLTDTDPNGHSQSDVESLFASKLDQLDYICQQQTGSPLADCVEVWFYTYNTHQDVSEITNGLADLIQTNPEFQDSEICVIGYSEGGVVTWLLDQRYELIEGGILLGAPILGSPLADANLTKIAAQQIWPGLSDNVLQPFVDWLLGGSDNLINGYPESGSAKSKLMLFAGKIALPNGSATIQLADVVVECADSLRRGLGVQASNRQVAQCGVLLINAIPWRDNSVLDKQSDGLVPISSATYGSSNVQIWEGYDHYDLLSGKDDLIIEGATFEWIDYVLHLRPEFVEPEDIPELPEIDINVPSANVLANTKFAYIKDGRLVLADAGWSTQQIITTSNSWYPQFSSTGNKLVWTQYIDGRYVICLLETGEATSIADGWYASFSPDGEKIVFARDDQLICHELASNEETILVTGIDLISPPVWWKSPLASRVYFVTKQNQLYWVDADAQNLPLASASLISGNCAAVFPFRGYLTGVAAAENLSNSTTRFWLVAGLLGQDWSLDINMSEQPGFTYHGTDWLLELDQTSQFDAVTTDWETGVYLTGTFSNQLGIYYLDAGRLLNQSWNIFQNNSPPQLTVNDIFKLVAPGGEQLDIKPASE